MKKVTNVLISAISVAIIASTTISGISVSAANSTDSHWYSGNGYTRYKEDYSSIYVKNASYYNAYVNVWGSDNAGNHYWVDSFGGVTLQTFNVKIPGNCERRVRQFIKEKGYNYAYVSFSGDASDGLWSPDCENEYLYYPAN